jgi:hypothetical protein
VAGSRRRTDREAVEAFIAELAPETVVVTGGAQGPDQWAEEAARARGLAVAVHKPDLDGAVDAMADGGSLLCAQPTHRR